MKRIALALALLTLGCGDGKATVEGTVALDGKPVENGGVLFVRTEGGEAREGAVIRAGSFTTTMPPGTYRVELNAQKVVSTRKQKGFDGKDEVIEISDEVFPEKYNKKSVLSEKISAGVNRLKFDLKSP